MKRGIIMKKVWLGIAAVLVLVVIGGLFYFLSNLNSIIARIIEDKGSQVVATDVAVSGVDISLRQGRGTIAGLSVASPDGFEASHVFTLGEITVALDLDSVRKDPIVIEEIRVRAPVVNAEILQTGSSNIGELQKNIQQYTASLGEGGQQSGDVKRIRIKRFVFEKGRIEVNASALGLEERLLDLPTIQLDDIGSPEGALPDEIAQAVLGALTRKATAEIARAGIENKVKDLVTDQAGDKAREILDKIGN
jgi:uncharacterized protein involved in outer membrane biogenesis